MEQMKKIAINPELESLRLQALNLVNNEISDSNYDNLINRTSRIHAAFLFHSPNALQALIRALGETNLSATNLGWQSFGDKLGLDLSILKVINNNHFNQEDPVYNTLLHYVQYEDATIGKIIIALKEMGRLDVIMRTTHVLSQLTDIIYNHEQEILRSAISSSRSHYGSLLSIEFSGDNNPGDGDPGGSILRPKFIPKAPFIMKNIKNAPLLSSLLPQESNATRTSVVCSDYFSRSLAALPLSQATPFRVNPSLKNNSYKYGKKVMLTFAADGVEAALEISQVFRRQKNNLGPMGVLILGEQMRHLNADPTQFITLAFHQVDYVVPIVTEGYLKSILRTIKTDLGVTECADAHYAPFIYKLMTTHYTNNYCLNDKVRCLLPDESIDKVSKQLMFVGPLFTVWERTSCAEQFAQRLLNSQI